MPYLGIVWSYGNETKTESLPTVSYVVKKGESLSKILYKLELIPLWGPHGFVRRVQNYNSGLILSSGDLILAGSMINIPTMNAREESKKPTFKETSDRSLANDTSSLTKDVERIPSWFVDTVSVGTHFGFLGLNSTDRSNGTSAVVSSTLIYGLQAEWAQYWSDRLQTLIFADISKVDFEPTSNRTLTNQATSLFNFGLAGRFAPVSTWNKFFLIAALDYRQVPFLWAPNTSSLNIDRVPLAEGAIGLSIQLVERGPYKLDVEGNCLFRAPVDAMKYKVHAGYGYVGKLRLDRKIKDSSSIEASFFYQSINQNTSITTQREVHLGLGVSWILRLGK